MVFLIGRLNSDGGLLKQVMISSSFSNKVARQKITGLCVVDKSLASLISRSVTFRQPADGINSFLE